MIRQVGRINIGFNWVVVISKKRSINGSLTRRKLIDQQFVSAIRMEESIGSRYVGTRDVVYLTRLKQPVQEISG